MAANDSIQLGPHTKDERGNVYGKLTVCSYAGRGITVCDHWRTSFVNFLADMGPKPFSEATIDRYPDQNGPYSPENCRWATKLEQSQNSRKARMLTYNGETMCLRAWARKLGITHRTLSERIRRGWPEDRVFAPKE